MKITDDMINAGLQHYSEGGCIGLDTNERKEVVKAILEAGLAALDSPGMDELANDPRYRAGWTIKDGKPVPSDGSATEIALKREEQAKILHKHINIKTGD